MGEGIGLAGLIFLAAALYSSVGHAGASGYLAAMALFGTAPHAMRPSALALNILVSTIATFRYVRAGQFAWRNFWPFAITSVPAAFIGGSMQLPDQLYKAMVGAILLVAAAEMVRSARRPNGEDDRCPPLFLALPIGAGIGLLSGLTGTGGGIFLSPIMLIAGWAGTRRTSGISAAFILLNSVAGFAGATFSWAALPDALPLWLAVATLGGLLGTWLGIRFLPVPALRYALAAVLCVAAGKLILS